jgi:hypothetical protein
MLWAAEMEVRMEVALAVVFLEGGVSESCV